MCRAIWIVVVAPTAEACKALRRAAGPEAQVVGMATSAEEARALLATTEADAIVIDGSTPQGAALIGLGRAIVWVGADAPDGVHASTTDFDTVEGAITRALIARNASRGS